MNNLSSLKYNQLLARPAQFNAPKTEEDKKAGLNPLETRCLNLQLKKALGQQAYTPKQIALLERIGKLSCNIYHPQLNQWRLFISHLAVMPKHLGFSQAVTTDFKTNHKMQNKEELCADWNRTLLKVYSIFEISCYEVKKEKEECITSLNQLKDNIPPEAFVSQELYDSVQSDLQLLSDALQDEELLSILLTPLDKKNRDYLLTSEKIDHFLKVLTLSKEAANQCIIYAKKLPKQPKNTVTERLNQWILMITELERNCRGILSLQDKALAGSEEALFKLSKDLHLLSPQRINQEYVKLWNSIEQAVPNKNSFQLIGEGFLRHSAALLTRTSSAIFDTLDSELEISTEFIRKLQPQLKARSDYFSPLDIYRMWWMEPFLENISENEDHKEIVGQLEMLFQILQDPDCNIYGKLEHLNIIFKKLEGFKARPLNEEPFNLFQFLLQTPSYGLLLAWLNTPLNRKSYKGDDTKFFLKMKSQYAQLVRLEEKVTIPCILDSTQENILNQNHNHQIKLQEEANQTFEQPKHTERESIDHFARTAYSRYGNDSIEQLENMLRELTSLDIDTKNKWFMWNEDIRKLYLRPFILKGADLAPLKAPKKIRHLTSDQPQPPPPPLAKTIKQKKPKTRKTSEPKVKPIRPTLQNTFEILLQSAPHSLRFNLRNLISLLEDPVSVEAIYCTLARTLEAHFQPEQNHSLEQFGKNAEETLWLQKMQSFLPLRFVPSEIDPDELEEDLKRTAQILGAQNVYAFSLNRPEYSDEEIWVSKFKSALQKSLQRLNEEGINQINGEYLLERRIRLKLCKDIIESSESTVMEVEQILKQAKERALPQAILGHLMLKAGQLVEGSMKLHFLTAPIVSEANPQSHRAFEEVAGRPRRYDHDLARIYEVSTSVVRIEEKELELIQKWRHFATTTRYETSPSDCRLSPFLKKAALLYPEFLTAEQSKELKQLSLEGKGREELLRIQQEELIPEVEKLLEISLKLF